MLGCDWVPHQVIIITLVSSSQKLSWPPIMGYEWVQVYKLQSWLKESGKVQNLEETSEIFSRLSPTRTSSGNPFHLPSFLCCNHLPAIWLFYHFIFVPLSAGSFDLQRHRLFQAARMSSNQEHDPNHHHLHNNHHRPPLINLINNPSSHFRRQVWAAWGWNRFGIQRGLTRPTAGIHRSELEILRSCRPHSALSCIFVFLYFSVCICVFVFWICTWT